MYRDTSKTGDKPEYAFYLYEGEIKYGEPFGFGRIITPEYSFVGYNSGGRVTDYGTGIYFEKFKFVNSGFYLFGQKFNDPPKVENTTFKTFTNVIANPDGVKTK